MAKIKKDGARANKAHFNVIDAVVIVLVIAVALGVYFRFNIVDRLRSQANTADYAVSFSVEDIRYTTPNYINVGDEVYFADSGELFGTLMSESENTNALNIVPASKYFKDSNGNVVQVFYPDGESRVDAKGRISCRGYYDESGGFSVDGRQYIAPGQTLNVRTELVTLTLTVTSIEAIAEE